MASRARVQARRVGELTVRQVEASDHDDMLAMSRNVYNGHDYLPSMFEQWCVDPTRTMIGVEADGHLVGLETVTVLDGGRTVMLQAGSVARQAWGRAEVRVGAPRRLPARAPPRAQGSPSARGLPRARHQQGHPGRRRAVHPRGAAAGDATPRHHQHGQ
jgi:hypothetical protein